MKKAVLGLSFMEKEQEKIAPQPNIYRKENKQHQIENQRLSNHPFGHQESSDLSGSNTLLVLQLIVIVHTSVARPFK
jgi:hypothetical protein